MTTTPQVLAFAGVVVLGAMSPGPDFAVVVRHSIVSGRARGMAAAAGIAAGVLLWASIAASGIAALIAVAPGLLTVIKLGGAGYLSLLGVKALWSARQAGGVRADYETPVPAGPDRWTAFRDGLVCNVLNPKAAVFFVALLPQFLPAAGGLVETLTLSVIAVAITAAWFLTVATLVAALRRLFRRPWVRRCLDGLAGVAFIGFGLRLAFASAR